MAREGLEGCVVDFSVRSARVPRKDGVGSSVKSREKKKRRKKPSLFLSPYCCKQHRSDISSGVGGGAGHGRVFAFTNNVARRRWEEFFSVDDDDDDPSLQQINTSKGRLIR